jgi:hypothetical protein
MLLRFIILFPITIFLLISLPNFPLWRDTPEFVLVAFYQDIAHPAGFPFYGMLSNLFTMLPFGTITWRVNLFSMSLA